jgi:hypothetical protein
MFYRRYYHIDHEWLQWQQARLIHSKRFHVQGNHATSPAPITL